MTRLKTGLLALVIVGSWLAVSPSAQVTIQRGWNTISGHLLFSPDNTYDIGASGATRPRNIYVANNVQGGNIYAANASVVGWVGRSVLRSPTDGVVTLLNLPETDFSRLQFGGTTSSFPALKRSGPTLQVRLADDSGYSALSASSVAVINSSVTAGSGTGITVDSSGQIRRTVYKVTIDRTAFVAAATTADVTLATLPAKTILNAIFAELTQTFACTATCTSSTLSMIVGSSAGGNNLLVSFDADAATAVFGDADAELGTGINRANAIQGGFLGSFSDTTAVNLRLTSGTGNIGNGSATNLSQGSVTFYLVTERLP